MFLNCLGPDNDVVEIHVADHTNKVLQCSHHMMLVTSRCVTDPHRHYCPLNQAPGCEHCCEMNVVRVDLGLEKRVSHVNFAKYLTLGAVTQDSVNTRERMVIWNSVRIELAEVIHPAWQDSGVRLGNNECRRGMLA